MHFLGGVAVLVVCSLVAMWVNDCTDLGGEHVID